MLIDLRKIERSLVSEKQSVDAKSLDFAVETGVSLVSLEFGYTFLRENSNRFFLQGKMSGEMKLPCSRCLAECSRKFDDRFDLFLVPEAPPEQEVQGEEIMLAEEDLSTVFYRDDMFDLGELLREQIILSIPMKNLCSEDCKGLCAVCGINMNLESCRCGSQNIDPRLAVLNDIKAKMKNV